MSELFFLRHGRRIDHALDDDPAAEPIYPDYIPYDPSLAKSAIPQIKQAADDILSCTSVFDPSKPSGTRKNIFIHFSPYLRTCQTADILMTNLKESLAKKYPNYKAKFSLLGDFALSEWVHEKMKEKPPFIDSNDAYQMYTPNVKLMKNRSACSNFRPTNTLGPYNGLDLSYKDYQSRCKDYFQKLIATYDKPINLKNEDIIIVVSHGYVINNFMSYFINHPIFEEVPECKINYARKIAIEDEEEVDEEASEDSEDEEASNHVWKLFKDSLGILESEKNVNSELNLETDIVYYKTNFIKKDELHKPEKTDAWSPSHWDYPRASFKIETLPPQDSQGNPVAQEYKSSNLASGETIRPPLRNNPICAAAKDWVPDNISHSFKMKSEFSLKRMDSQAFKEDYDLSNHPLRPISPEVSPTSEPTRNNSVIDLSKLVDNDEIYKPIKLKYSTTGEIPIHRLNSRVNSQVNLAQAQRSNGSSANSSIVDFSKFVNSMQSGQPLLVSTGSGSGSNAGGNGGGRKRSLSNPVVEVVHEAKDSYFPSGVKITSNGGSSNSLEQLPMSPTNNSGSDLNMIEEKSGYTPQSEIRPNLMNMMINRSTSLNHKKNPNVHGSLSLLAKYQEKLQSENQSTETSNTDSDNEPAEQKKETAAPVEPFPSSSEKGKEKETAAALQSKLFALSFNQDSNKAEEKSQPLAFPSTGSSGPHALSSSHHNSFENNSRAHGSSNRRRRSSLKFIPSVITQKKSPILEAASSNEKPRSGSKGAKPLFYNLNSDDSNSDSFSDDSDSEGSKKKAFNGKDETRSSSTSGKAQSDYLWFGQNRN